MSAQIMSAHRCWDIARYFIAIAYLQQQHPQLQNGSKSVENVRISTLTHTNDGKGKECVELDKAIFIYSHALRDNKL